MRRWFALFAVLILLSLFGITAAAVYVNNFRETVVFTETTLFGDSSAAEGVCAEYTVHYDNHLFWDIVCHAGSNPAASAEFSYSAAARRAPDTFEPFRGVSLENQPFYDMDFMAEDKEPKGLEIAFRKLYEECPPGEERSTVVYLKDYYEFYPINGTIRLGDLFVGWNEATVADNEEQFSIPFSEFGDFFKIPVLEKESIEVHLSRVQNGLSFGIGSGINGSAEAADSFSLYTHTATGEDACYFTFNNRTAQGNLVDTSLIPGGYGIYSLPLKQKEGKLLPDPEALYCCYPLPETTIVEGLYLSSSGEHLLLLTSEAEGHLLTVIEVSGMRPIQTLLYDTRPNDSIHSAFPKDGYFVLTLNNDRLVLFEEKEDGTYRIPISAPLFPDPQNPLFYTARTLAVEWDGTILLLADHIQSRYSRTPDFFLSVYSEDGLLYMGEYHCSLNTGFSSSSSAYYCAPYRNTLPKLSRK